MTATLSKSQIFAFAIVVLSAVIPRSEVSAESTEWWNAKEVQRAVGLTPHQVAALDDLYRHSLPQRKGLRAELDRLEARLARAMERGDDSVLALIDTVEEARTRRNTLRAVMLFRMYKLLTVRQRQLLAQFSSLPDGSVK
jgi:Spy/CpxP family protein refolding chaperone